MAQVFYRLLIVGLLCGVSITANLKAADSAAEGSKGHSGRVYSPVEHQDEVLTAFINKAAESNKLALLVMGANWCHDSRGLAKRLNSQQVKDQIEQNYDVLYIDVGYLSNIKPVITRFGIPVIYATPTVLVLDPKSEKVINRDNMHIWRSAGTIGQQQTLDYFNDIAENKAARLQAVLELDLTSNKDVKRLITSIDRFELSQANRLYKAFEIVGPLLQADIEGKEAGKIDEYWRAVSRYRRQLTDDLVLLRKQVVEFANSGGEENKTLEFPSYTKFEWEK
jgi:hypothetical protein